jgi:hypothetical protein
VSVAELPLPVFILCKSGKVSRFGNAVPALDANGLIPAGDDATGGYHSHGAYDPIYANDRFSGEPGDVDRNGNLTGDVVWSTFTNLPLSVATPGGNAIIYYPGPGCQMFFLGSPLGTGTTIPIC